MPAVPTTPKGRRTHTQILAAARLVFGRDGYNGMRMSDVATEAGLSMGGLYRYFDNKTALFEAVIGDIHEELYTASRTGDADFASEPFASLLEANVGYLAHYYEHRDVMRAFIEAANIDRRFREIWWDMRRRHTERFAEALRTDHGITEVDGIDAGLAADAMACMVEQCAYVWYAHEDLSAATIPVETAGRLVTRTWFRTFFAPRADGELDAEASTAALDALRAAQATV